MQLREGGREKLRKEKSSAGWGTLRIVAMCFRVAEKIGAADEPITLFGKSDKRFRMGG